MAGSDQGLATCPTWHRPLLRVVPDGIEVKCKFCGGTIHTISRDEIEKQWNEASNTSVYADMEKITVS